MGITITPPSRRNRQAEITSPAARRLRGLGMPETHERNMHGQNIRSEHVPPATPEASVAIAATATPEISREQTSEPAKPSLRNLAGVKPADGTGRAQTRSSTTRLSANPRGHRHTHPVVRAVCKSDHACATGHPLQRTPTDADHAIQTISGERNHERRGVIRGNNTKPAAFHGTKRPEQATIRTNGTFRSG